jgi:hypothetical protein
VKIASSGQLSAKNSIKGNVGWALPTIKISGAPGAPQEQPGSAVPHFGLAFLASLKIAICGQVSAVSKKFF